MSYTSSTLLGISCRFSVSVDQLSLGNWATCTGLHVDFQPFAIEEGGNNDGVCWEPGRLRYDDLVLTRAMDASSAGLVQNWLSTRVDFTRDSAWGQNAVVTLLDSLGGVVYQWTLRNVMPKSWKGPDLNATSTSVGIETLELVHEGWL